jgi:hypothetical protein
MFRTKGVYLDLKEILKDPPHTPPDFILDPRFIQEDDKGKMAKLLVGRSLLL